MVTESRRVPRHRARLTRQGQITVPKAIRDALGARPGDDVEFVRRGDDLLVELRPRRTMLDFAGLAADTAVRIPASAEALDEVVARAMADEAVARVRRSVRQPRRLR